MDLRGFYSPWLKQLPKSWSTGGQSPPGDLTAEDERVEEPGRPMALRTSRWHLDEIGLVLPLFVFSAAVCTIYTAVGLSLV